MYWEIYDRSRNVRGKKCPFFVTIWTGRDSDGAKRWLVSHKPDPNIESGAIYSQQGGPGYSDHQRLTDAIAVFKREEM